jgi:hypothetical protein
VKEKSLLTLVILIRSEPFDRPANKRTFICAMYALGMMGVTEP